MKSQPPGAELIIDARVAGDAYCVVLAGSADLAAREALQTFMRGLHAKACALGVREVTVDFRHLQFMNSSCFKGFVDWLSDVQKAGTERHYQIRFLSNPAFTWQRRSLQALRCFAMDAIRIEQ